MFGHANTLYAAMLNHTKYCRWCGDNEEMTRDHILPSSLGGSNDSYNIVDACYKCNQDRGNIVGWYKHRLRLIKDFESIQTLSPLKRKRLNKAIIAFNRNFDKYKLVQEKWIKIEKIVLGYSISESFELSKICL